MQEKAGFLDFVRFSALELVWVFFVALCYSRFLDFSCYVLQQGPLAWPSASEVARERQDQLGDVVSQLHDSVAMRCFLTQLLLGPSKEVGEVHRVVVSPTEPRLCCEDLTCFLRVQSICPCCARHDTCVLPLHWQRASTKIVAMTAPLRQQTLLNPPPRGVHPLARQLLSSFCCLAVSKLSSIFPPWQRLSGRRAAAGCRHHSPLSPRPCAMSRTVH